MKKNNIYIILLTLIFCFINAKQTIFLSFYDYDSKNIIKKNIYYKIKDSNDEILQKGKLKKNRKKHKIKYNFDDYESQFTGGYTITFEWLDKNKIKRQNELKIKKNWYLNPDFVNGSISGEQKDNNERNIKVLDNGRYPYTFKIPLKKKNSVIHGRVYDDDGYPLKGARVELNKRLNGKLSGIKAAKTNSNGYFKIDAYLKNDEIIKKGTAALILTAKDHHPKYKYITPNNIIKRDTTSLSEIILHRKNFSPDSLDCIEPRVWNDKCSDCICDSHKEMWYYELGICDVRECPNPSEKIFIKNNKVICEEPPTLEDISDYDEDENYFESLSQKIVTLKFIDNNNIDIKDIQIDYDNGNYELSGISSDIGRVKLDYYNGSNDVKAEFSVKLDIDYNDFDEKLISLNGYNYTLDNFFYLSEEFSEEKNAIEEIDIIYKNVDYILLIQQSEIQKIVNHDILSLVFKFEKNNFFLDDINYLDEFIENTIFNESESDYIDISESISYSECFTEFEMLENSYRKCKKSKRNFKYIKDILHNSDCNTDLNDYMNNIYMINSLYPDVMEYTDNEFLCLFKIDENKCLVNINELNKFEYLDLIFQHMNSLNQNENSVSSIMETNRNPYKANIYLKQVQFYYKYFELLYSLKGDIKEFAGDSKRGPMIYKFYRASKDNRIKSEENNSFDFVLLTIKNRLKDSILNYKRYSEKSQNWANYGSVEVQGIENKIQWIKHEF